MSNAVWYGNRAKAATVAGIRGLREGAEALLTETIDDTPIKSGTMRRSGTVTQGGPPPDPGAIFSRAKAGGQSSPVTSSPLINGKIEFWVSFNTPYARRQHEETTWKHPVGGQAKYLENNFRKMRPKILRRVQDLMKQALRG